MESKTLNQSSNLLWPTYTGRENILQICCNSFQVTVPLYTTAGNVLVDNFSYHMLTRIRQFLLMMSWNPKAE